MPQWVVFSIDDGAGRAEAVEAASAEAAEALVLAAHPGAITSVVPAAALMGCHRGKPGNTQQVPKWSPPWRSTFMT